MEVGYNDGVISFSNPLTVSSRADVSSEVGNATQLSWVVSGSEGTYILFKNGISLDTGFWFSNMQVTTNLAELNVGTYNYTIVFRTDFEVVSDTVFVTIFPLNDTIISSTSDISSSTRELANSSTNNITVKIFRLVLYGLL